MKESQSPEFLRELAELSKPAKTEVEQALEAMTEPSTEVKEALGAIKADWEKEQAEKSAEKASNA